MAEALTKLRTQSTVVQYEYVGTLTIPKGAVSKSAGADAPSVDELPSKNLTASFGARRIIDFPRGRGWSKGTRAITHIFARDSGRQDVDLILQNGEGAYDEEVSTGVCPIELIDRRELSTIYAGLVPAEFEIWKIDRSKYEFEYSQYPFFFAEGVILEPQHTLVAANCLPQMNSENWRVTGNVVIDDVLCPVVTSVATRGGTYFEFTLNPIHSFSPIRWIWSTRNSVLISIDIKYKSTSGRPELAGWTLTRFLDSGEVEAVESIEIKGVTRLADVPASQFRLSPSSGMIVRTSSAFGEPSSFHIAGLEYLSADSLPEINAKLKSRRLRKWVTGVIVVLGVGFAIAIGMYAYKKMKL